MGDWDRRFRESNDYAVHHGFASGRPNFHEADYGDGVVNGTFLLPPHVADFRDVPAAEYDVYRIDDVGAMFRGANDFAARQGYAGGVPTFHQADYGAGVVYGTFLIKPGQVEFRDVPAAELGVWDRERVPDMMRAASDYAAAHGFSGAFPTFHEADYGSGLVFGMILFHQGASVWRDLPADLLRRYSDPPTPLAVVLCRPSDVAPGAGQRWADLLLPGGADPGNAVRYWSDLSYGQYDAAGSQVFGWLDLGHTQAEIAAYSGQQQRAQLSAWGQQAARQAGVRLGDFRQIVLGFNINADHGSVGGNTVVLAYAEGRPFEPTFVHHELGHALGRGHSSSTVDGVYGDRFDIMSAMNVWTFTDSQARQAGPGAASVTLQNCGWLHRSRVWRGVVTSPQTITLAALNRPDVDGYLAVQLGPPAFPFGPFYYLEYREPTAWDRGLPGPRVLVHTRNGENEAEILGGGWNPAGAVAAGSEIVLSTFPAPVTVRVEQTDQASARAVVHIRPS